MGSPSGTLLFELLLTLSITSVAKKKVFISRLTRNSRLLFCSIGKRNHAFYFEMKKKEKSANFLFSFIIQRP